MKIVEFEAFLEENNLTLPAAVGASGTYNIFGSEIELLRRYWIDVKQDISPHFYGKSMPKSIIEAFPNETDNQLDYRRRSYESPTFSYFWRAIQDVNRIVINTNFIANFGQGLAAYFKQKKNPYQGLSIDAYISSELYNLRVLDPNGYIAVLPTNVAALVDDGEGNLVSNKAELNKSYGVKINFYPSEDLIYRDENILIWREQKVTNRFGLGAVNSNTCYRVVTNKGSFLYDPTGATNPEKYKEYLHQEGRDWLPAAQLGGQTVTKKDLSSLVMVRYYNSDFSFAVPAMNELAVITSQFNVVTATSTYPIRLTRVIPCIAKDCDRGAVIEKDNNGQILFDEYDMPKKHKCTTCNGSGVVNFNTMNGIVVPEKTELDGDKNTIPLSDMLHYAAPPVQIVTELRDQKRESETNLEQTLSIVRQKTVGQTAESKEMDNDQKQTFLTNIAMGMARLKETILVSTIYYVLPEKDWQSEVAEVNVAVPKSFNIASTEALRSQRDANRKDKTLAVRAAENLQLIEKETDNALEIQAVEWLQEYTQNRSEATADELEQFLISEIITPQQYAEALFASATIRKILSEQPDIKKPDLFAKLKDEFASFAKVSDIAVQFRNMPIGN